MQETVLLVPLSLFLVQISSSLLFGLKCIVFPIWSEPISDYNENETRNVKESKRNNSVGHRDRKQSPQQKFRNQSKRTKEIKKERRKEKESKVRNSEREREREKRAGRQTDTERKTKREEMEYHTSALVILVILESKLDRTIQGRGEHESDLSHNLAWQVTENLRFLLYEEPRVSFGAVIKVRFILEFLFLFASSHQTGSMRE